MARSPGCWLEASVLPRGLLQRPRECLPVMAVGVLPVGNPGEGRAPAVMPSVSSPWKSHTVHSSHRPVTAECVRISEEREIQEAGVIGPPGGCPPHTKITLPFRSFTYFVAAIVFSPV